MARPKSNRITIGDIARAAGVSQTTVSFFLNGKRDRMAKETSERIARIIEETGYRPSSSARGTVSRKSGLIAVICDGVTDIRGAQMVHGIEGAASERGYRVLSCMTNHDREREAAYIERLLDLGVDGIVIKPTASFKQISSLVESRGRGLVFIEPGVYSDHANWVKTNNYDATYSAISECVARGYRRFVRVAADPHYLGSLVERHAGFDDALAAAGLPTQDYAVEGREVEPTALAEFFRRQLEAADAEAGEGQADPILVFVPNGWLLPTVYRAMLELRTHVPERIGLLGYDNEDWTGLATPSISAIEQPAFEEGREACNMLLDIVSGKKRTQGHRTFESTVAWRGTTL
ncbi:MAG: LacI family DNA-binding transcriptional regulator [Olsenella sp.]|nr:LacI family DNA-binding transcriptional regulator [Olsenella sp.]